MYIPGTTCLHIPLAHPCLYWYLLIHSILYCTFYLIAHFTPYFNLFYYLFLFLFYSYLYLYIFSCVMFHCFIFIIFFCTVHWADLSWLTFHYWLYPVWLRMWRIIQKLERWTSTWATKQKSANEIHISCVYIQDMTTWKHAANEINTQAADITWMHAADKNMNCLHTTRHMDRGAHGRAN